MRYAHTRGGVSQNQAEPTLSQIIQPPAEDNLSLWQGDHIWASKEKQRPTIYATVLAKATAAHICLVHFAKLK